MPGEDSAAAAGSRSIGTPGPGHIGAAGLREVTAVTVLGDNGACGAVQNQPRRGDVEGVERSPPSRTIEDLAHPKGIGERHWNGSGTGSRANAAISSGRSHFHRERREPAFVSADTVASVNALLTGPRRPSQRKTSGGGLLPNQHGRHHARGRDRENGKNGWRVAGVVGLPEGTGV